MLTETSSNTGQAARPAGREIDGLIRDALEALELEWADEAIVLCERALEQDRECAEAVFILGLVYFDMHEASRAIEVLELAHKLNPKRQEFAEALAAIMVRIGKVNEALYYAKMATVLERHPTLPNLLPERFGSFFKNMDHGDPNLYLTRAKRSMDLGDIGESVKYAQRQLELTPDNGEALSVMARACLMAGQFEASASAVQELIEQAGPEPEDLANLASALAALGHSDEAEAYCLEALTRAPDDAVMHSRVLAELVRRPGASAARIKEAHAQWNRQHARSIRPRVVKPRRADDPERRLRVAYVSGSFFGSDLAEMFEPVLHAHRLGGIESYCYAEGKRSDTTTECLMHSAAKWTETTRIDDETVWEIMRGDEIDIAVDLSGHFAGGRPLLFARRPAPVSVSWLGYPYPLGLPGLDYFIADQTVSPPNARTKAAKPGIWHLPRSPYAYIAQTSVPDVTDLPAARNGHLTFGANCDLSLITPDLARAWSQMLSCHEPAKLLICNRYDADSASVRRISDLFSHFGQASRVTIVNMSENFESGFSFYEHVDITLDTGSIDSLAENCRALYMGVPVLTLAGPHPAARVSASVVEAAGHPDWAARTTKGFAALAAKLGKDPGKLAGLRASLRDEVKKSPLGNPVDLASALETAYREMWRKCCAES